MTSHVLTISASDPEKGSKVGDFITNNVLIAAVFQRIPNAAFVAVCSKPRNPAIGGWVATRADQSMEGRSPENNNYFGCSSFYLGDDASLVRKAQFSACHIEIEVSFDRRSGLELIWLIENRRDNHQGRIILAAPITDATASARLFNIPRLPRHTEGPNPGAASFGPIDTGYRFPANPC